ncbi:putative protein, chloroplastic, partial [Mucuna pruriens]
MHSVICTTAVSPNHNHSGHLRNPNRLRAKSSLLIQKQDTQLAQPLSDSVSRRLILLRHAKSSWENRSLRDHDRPLSKSGKEDAVRISLKLQQLGWIPELILSSDAARTKETLRIMQEQVQELVEAEVHFVSSFYSIAAMDGQTAEHLRKVICRYSKDEILTVMCMGHNKGWEEAASMLSGASVELKTCNAALLETAGKSWDEAFATAGFGGWKLQGIVTPRSQSFICCLVLSILFIEVNSCFSVLKNSRGYTLKCSHYLPSSFPEDISLPCVIYCHGNSGCRADANEAAVILLPSNITVFTLDFSGSGLSDGDHVSLGWHEKDDLKMVVSHLRSNKRVSRIGLWGRSMGAVTSLLYGAEDPSIAGMVLDSAFSNLYDLMLELADVYKIRLPKFTVKMAVQYMRRVIEKKAKFDIMDLNCLMVAPKTFIPVLFGHGNDDQFIQPHHSDLISELYAGDKNVIKFNGDHNSSRPQFFYDSIAIFFYNVLRPPHIPKARKVEKYFDLGDLKIGSAVNESATTDAASSSSAPPSIPNSNTASVGKLISEVTPESMITEELTHGNDEPGRDEPADMKDEQNGVPEDYYSYTSSTRESWGRCSSLLLSDEESYPDLRGDIDAEVFATPMGSMREQAAEPKEEVKDQKKKKKAERSTTKKIKSDRFEKWESLSRRLRLCILKGNKFK